MCGLKFSLLSKIRPRYCVSSTTGMEFPYRVRDVGCAVGKSAWIQFLFWKILNRYVAVVFRPGSWNEIESI
jgi:hypothetical protein